MLRQRKGAVVLGGAILAAAIAASCSATHTTNGSSGATSGSGAADATSTADGMGGGINPSVGSSSGNGGSGGGMATPGDCDACMKAGGKCVSGKCILSENPGKLDAATQSALKAGGNADGAFKWLYPYDKTVFPRGLLPPTMQFAGGAPDAVYVHVTFGSMEYEGFFGGSNPGRVTFSGATWNAITMAAHATDWVKVEVTKKSGAAVTGPISEEWSVAQGSLRGTIYYETYDSALIGGIGSVGIMKINPGANQPVVLKSGCGNVCHTASADGSTLVSATGFLTNSVSYDLKSNASVIKLQGDQSFTYGGIYPDGTFLVSATNYRTWLGAVSRVYDSKTGVILPTPSFDGAVQHAGTPAFSPDGTMFAFNHEDTGGGHTLATMKYAKATKTFSGLTDVAGDPNSFLGWPAFTPDSKWIIYHAGSNNAFETDGGALGDLFIVDVATKKAARLDQVDGYNGSKTYLPASDPQLSFAPTVLPVAVGGYFWVVFTSHRSYGNTLPSKDNGDQNGKLWVAAIDLAPQDGKDPSHPAFYLDGQESKADNLRGFWVLDPCKENGKDCKTGDECCGGYCYEVDGKIQCRPTPNGCAKELEKCTTKVDCCDSDAECINGHCAIPGPK